MSNVTVDDSRQVRRPLPTIQFRLARCGCEGLHCYTCLHSFEVGDHYIQVGLTRFCMECVRDALMTMVEADAIVRGLARD